VAFQTLGQKSSVVIKLLSNVYLVNLGLWITPDPANSQDTLRKLSGCHSQLTLRKLSANSQLPDPRFRDDPDRPRPNPRKCACPPANSQNAKIVPASARIPKSCQRSPEFPKWLYCPSASDNSQISPASGGGCKTRQSSQNNTLRLCEPRRRHLPLLWGNHLTGVAFGSLWLFCDFILRVPVVFWSVGYQVFSRPTTLLVYQRFWRLSIETRHKV